MSNARKYLLFITLLHAVFFVLALYKGNIQLPDSGDYIWQAKNFEATGSFYANDPTQPIKIDYYSKRPPLYGLFIWGVTSIFGSLYGVLLLQNIISIFCAWLVYKLLRNDFGIEKPALWAGILWVLFPNQLLYANMVMSETLLQVLLVGSFYCFLRYLKTNKQYWIIANIVLLALALLTKPVMLYFWVISLVVLLFFAIKNRHYLLPLAVALLLLVAYWWSGLNYQQTGYRHYSSITHVNLKDYNTKYYLFAKYGSEYGDSVIAVIDSAVTEKGSYAQQCEYIKDTCKQILLSDVPAYGKFHARGMLNFMADPGRYDYVSFFNIAQTDGLGLLHYISKGDIGELKRFIKTQPIALIIVLLLQMAANVLILLMCVVFVFTKTPLWPKIYLLVMAGYIWFLTGPIGSARFKVPVYPLLVIAVVVAIYNFKPLIHKIKIGKHKA